METSMFQNKLRAMYACETACEYADKFPDLQSAWDACEQGDWMLWLLGKVTKSDAWGDDRKPLLAATLDCAEIAKHLWQPKTLEGVCVLRKWIAGDVSLVEAMQARMKLRKAYTVAAVAAAATADAADAEAYTVAAVAAAAAADAKAYTVAAVAAAATAAIANVDAAAKERLKYMILKDCAVIVRKHFPVAPEL